MPTISISSLDTILFPHVSDHHLRFRLWEPRHQLVFTDDLDLHTMELPKFTRPLEAFSGPLDPWLHFLRHAESLNTDALPPVLDRPPIRRALEELIMISQTDVERERYEARRKAQLDINTGFKMARLEGIQKGALMGTIHTCQRALKRPVTPEEQLMNMPDDELQRLADQLQAELIG